MTLISRSFAAAAISLLIVTAAAAQTGSIRGVVSDRESGERIPFATIAVYPEAGDQPVAGDVSDGEGNFAVEPVSPGDYRIVVSFIGYEPAEIGNLVLTAGSPVFDVGEIHLTASPTELDEVEVSALARTSSSRIDRTTYRASDFGTTRGGTASDLLNRLPSVSVDPDGLVSVRGTSDFIVYLNGRPSGMEPSMLLSQISAHSVESVEIITVPGARYEAHGAGGIININTRRQGIEGLSAMAGFQGGGAPWGETVHRYSGYEMNNDMYGGNLDLLFNRNTLSLYSNLHYQKRNVNGIRNGNARILQENGNYYNLEGTGGRPELLENISANAGIILELSERSSLDASYFYARRSESRSAFYLYNGRGLTGAGGGDYWTYNPNVGERLGTIHNTTIEYRLMSGSSSELSIMAAWEQTGLERDLSNPNFGYNEELDEITVLQRHFRQSDDTPLNGFRLHIDYRARFSENHMVEAGVQPQYLVNKGSFSYDTLSVASGNWGAFSSLENDFELTRGVYAAYLNYTLNTGSLNLVAGLRMEYTDQLMDVGNPDYFSLFDRETRSSYDRRSADWFPALHIGYRAGEKSDFTLAASRRINRPQTQNMAPFLYRRHHEVYEVGDPALEPEYLSNFELSWTGRAGNQNFTLTGFYRGTDNALFRIYTVYGEENILIRSFTNAGQTTAMGAELNANLVAGRIARLFLGGSLYNFRVSGDFFGYREDNSSTNWNLKATANFFLPASFRLTTDLDIRSATVTAQGREDLRFIAGAALDYTPERLRGWNFSLRLADILGSNITNWSTRAYNNEGRQVFFQETDYTRYGPVMEFGVTYSFNINGRTLRRDVDTFGEEQF